MKKGFSFGEMLATIIVIGIICTLSIPILTQSTSNKVNIPYKAAFQNVETVINELINDVSIYPSGEFIDNTFCANFFGKMNTIGYTSANCVNTFGSTFPPAADKPNAVTTNGMKWYNVEEDFSSANCPSGDPGECIRIKVDVNGSNGDNTDDIDILDIYIFNTGKVTVESTSTEESILLD